MSTVGETEIPAANSPSYFHPLQKKKKITESKRLRDVFRYCPKELRGLDLSSLLESSPGLAVPPPDFVPSPSPDSALTAFAQLGALRLRAARALISLLDGQNQYILTEATSTLPLRSGRRHDASHELWLGNVRIPRSSGVCERVLGLNALDTQAVVIDDMAESEQLCTRSYVKEGPKWRFYAGVPMRSPDGAVIGAFCIFDDKMRSGLSEGDLEILHDLADTVVEHLETYKLREENRRGERMVRGLTSFLEGASSLQHSVDNGRGDNEVWDGVRTTVGELQKPVLRQTDTENSAPREEASTGSGKTARPQAQAREKSASSILQDSILPPNARTMFSRAANIIRETSELDGVVIFDASIAGVGGHRERSPTLPRQSKDEHLHSTFTESRHQNEHSSTTHDTSSSDSSSTSHSKDRERCHILGFSCAGASSVAGDSADIGLQSLTEHDLKKMLKSYSGGKIMNFGTTEAMTSSDESTKEDDNTEENMVTQRQSKRRESTKRLMDVIQRIAPGARSLCFLPLWDYERSRWFVGCLFWTTQNDRLLSPTLDLVYLKAFGNSVMTELSRLDAIASNKTKTTFAASISHELRSPLHGILGGIEFLQQSDNLDPFQKSMLHSTAICGKTLLDTLNHVMDYAKINEINGNAKSYTRVMKSNSVRITSRPLRKKQLSQVSNISSMFDLSLVTEEVIEAVFASQSYRVAHDGIDDDHASQVMALGTNTSHASIGDDASRKLVLIILDIPRMDNWMFSMPVGAWRRVLMNLFGNALKYTNSGAIRVTLEQAKPEINHHDIGETKVVMTVKDTGIGMSPDFLANHLYSPFTQENHLSSGVGLGLNIVRQILESVNGNIDLTSDIGSGTEVSVTLSLPNLDEASTINEESESNLDSIRCRVRGYNVFIVDRAADKAFKTSQTGDFSSFATTLASTLHDWLDMDVFLTRDSQNIQGSDIIICTEPSFEFLASIRKQGHVAGKVPVVIFLAIDAIEAAALRTDVRVTSKESVVEIVSQPCGPYKLSRVLDHCMTRFESLLEENNGPSFSSNTSPSVSLPSEQQPGTHVLSERPKAIVEISNNRNRTTTTEGAATLTYHILIVDDNAINRRLLVALMKKHGFRYREAVNGHEAVNLYQATTSPRFNVVLMDLSMPIMDGMTASTEIRKYEREQRIHPTIIVALTGLVSASAKLEALESGIDFYMTKPVKFAKLMELLPL